MELHLFISRRPYRVMFPITDREHNPIWSHYLLSIFVSNEVMSFIISNLLFTYI